MKAAINGPEPEHSRRWWIEGCIEDVTGWRLIPSAGRG